MDEILLITPHRGFAQLTLNRPAQRNALNTALLGQLAATLGKLAAEADCRVVVLNGMGEHFAAGADIGEIETKTSAEAAHDPRKGHWAAIRAFQKPLIAAVDGFCLGGGFELALMADLIVLGITARVGLPETNLGLVPGAGGGSRLTSLVGRARAMRLVLGGEIIDAATAEAWGVAAFRAEGPALPMATELAAKLALRSPLALTSAKAAILAASEGPLAEGLALERQRFEVLLDTSDKAEGIRAFREKRKPEFRGA